MTFWGRARQLPHLNICSHDSKCMEQSNGKSKVSEIRLKYRRLGAWEMALWPRCCHTNKKLDWVWIPSKGQALWNVLVTSALEEWRQEDHGGSLASQSCPNSKLRHQAETLSQKSKVEKQLRNDILMEASDPHIPAQVKTQVYTHMHNTRMCMRVQLQEAKALSHGEPYLPYLSISHCYLQHLAQTRDSEFISDFFISFRLAYNIKSFLMAFSHIYAITLCPLSSLIGLLHCPPWYMFLC